MGGKSKSSSNTTTTTTQNITNENLQSEASGVVTGNILQGKIDYYDEFSPKVQESFNKLIDLSGDAGALVGNAFADLIALTNKSVDIARGAGEVAIEKVSQRSAQIENPNLSALQAFIPILLLGGIAAIVFAWRR